jgi:hypothetical protein
MSYEEGMQLVFDLLTRTVVVSFRGQIEMLGPFNDQKEAVSAGEKYCRDRGWIDGDVQKSGSDTGTPPLTD